MPLFLGEQILSGNNALNTTEKIYLIGAKNQEEGVDTFSQDKVYAEGGILYSEGKKVATEDYIKGLDKQDKITGEKGDFVIIGEDGKVTTKTVFMAENSSF